MPFVVKYDGKYLCRSPNATASSQRRRRFVNDINEATTWSEPGHAKNAAREAWSAKVIPVDAIVEIVTVKLSEGKTAGFAKRQRDRFGRIRIADSVKP